MRAEGRTLRVSAVALMGIVAGVALLRGVVPVGSHAAQNSPDYNQYRTRASIPVGGTARNFTRAELPGGHADFPRVASSGAGRYARIASDTLDDDGRPARASGGWRIVSEWRDAASRAIIPSKPYLAAFPGDTAGSMAGTEGDAVGNAAGFAQWFRDTPGVNTSARRQITWAFDADRGVYAYEGSLDRLFSETPDYTYTFEVDIPFIYESGRGWHLTASTDAEVWVYVNDKLVIDGGAGMGHVAAFAVHDSLLVKDTARVSGPGGEAIELSTNSVDAGDLQVRNNAVVTGSVLVGPGGNPLTVVQTDRVTSITGTRGALTAPVPMAAMAAPTDLGASVGDRIYNGGTHTINSSFRCKTFVMQNHAVVNISGNVTIYAEDKFNVENQARINLQPGATLRVFAGKDIIIQDQAQLNTNTGDPSRFTLVNLGTTKLMFQNGSNVVGNVHSPRGAVEIGNNTSVTGAVLAHSAVVHNTGQFIGVGNVGDLLAGGRAQLTQRFDFDRLAGLSEGQTHRMRVFFANRTGRASTLRLETNMDLLNLAAVPLPRRVDID